MGDEEQAGIAPALAQAGIDVRCASQKAQRLVGTRKDAGGEPDRRNRSLQDLLCTSTVVYDWVPRSASVRTAGSLAGGDATEALR